MESKKYKFRHSMPAQLRFSDVDRFGHVNNSVYFSLFDMCKTHYFNDVVGTDIFDRVAPVVVHIEANFITPVYFPDEIVIQTSITRIGNKSFTLFQRALNDRTHEVKCECETVMVMMDTQVNVSVNVPDDFRTAVETYESNAVDCRVLK